MSAEQLERIERPLRHLFRTTRPVIPAHASAEAMLESAIRCGVEKRLLAVVGGESGERLARIAEACGKEVVRAVVPPGRVLEPDHLARFLGGPEIDAVSVAQVDASSGALAPLEALARVTRGKEDVLFLVDATLSLAADPLEFDLWQLDFACGSSEQSLGIEGGPALAVASKRLLARAASEPHRGWVLDLVRLDAEVRDRRLPGSEIRVGELERALVRLAEAEGVEGSWRRHARVRAEVDAWASTSRSLEPLAAPGRRGGALTVFRRAGATPALATLLHPGHLAPQHLATLLAGLDASTSPVT